MSGHVLIIGGGVIGSAIASFVLRDRAFAGRVTVIERDPSYARASSALSASSIRQQFTTPANIALSRFGIQFLREIGDRLQVDGERPDVGLVEPGYLYLATPDRASGLARNHALQRAQGVDVALLDPAAMASRFPWLTVGDLACGVLGLTGEGWFDGYSVMQAFRRHARALGARYLHAEAVGFDVRSDSVRAVLLSDGTRIEGDEFVNAAGPWAATIANWLDIALPVRARRRCVFAFACPTPLPRCPLVIDPSGLWFRPEGEQRFICGISPPEGNDPDDAPLDVDHHLFDEVLWPSLAHRVPAFEAVRVTGAWAGYYEYNTFDQNAIVGRHPQFGNFVFANGFSGHGMQQAPGVGRGVAELLVHGGYRTLDLSPFAFERIAAERPLVEGNVI
jgi:FAD-dependent oxidoreductase domain-containing protein 1